MDDLLRLQADAQEKVAEICEGALLSCLYDGGDGNTDLDGLVLVFYNGNGDTSYNAFDLDGYSTDANGYFVLGNSGVSPTPDVTFNNNSLQNGSL